VGAKVAEYKYAPFGQTISSAGTKASDFYFRFFTRCFDSEIDLYYYGYRYYSPNLSRWLNRDPLGDMSFYTNYAKQFNNEDEQKYIQNQFYFSSYLAFNNNPITYYDKDGAIVPLIIATYSYGSAISNGISGCYSCYKYIECMKRSMDLATRAQQSLDLYRYELWLAKAKPGSECTSLAGDCGVSALRVVFWVGGKLLVFKYAINQ